MTLVGFDQARDSCPNPGQLLRRDITLDVADMVGAQLRQPAINLGADQRGIAEQLDDRLPDERLHHVLPDWTIDTAAASRGSIGVGARTSIRGASRRRVVRVEHRQERIAA